MKITTENAPSQDVVIAVLKDHFGITVYLDYPGEGYQMDDADGNLIACCSDLPPLPAAITSLLESMTAGFNLEEKGATALRDQAFADLNNLAESDPKAREILNLLTQPALDDLDRNDLSRN